MITYLFTKSEAGLFAYEYGVDFPKELQKNDRDDAIRTLKNKGVIKIIESDIVLDNLPAFLFKEMADGRRFEYASVQGRVYSYECKNLIIAVSQDIRNENEVNIVPFQNKFFLNEWLNSIGGEAL